MKEVTPTRFESLYPKEAKALMKLYREGKKLRVYIDVSGTVNPPTP